MEEGRTILPSTVQDKNICFQALDKTKTDKLA